MEPIDYAAFEPEKHLAGVCDICERLEWDNFRYSSDLTRKSLTAPGVTSIVAVSGESVVGFAQIISDGLGLQTHLSLLAVDREWRRPGIGRGLVREGLQRIGAVRMDLISSDESLEFYRSFDNREQAGFRLYPGSESLSQEA